MCTWGLTKSQANEIDRAHRKQLRKVFNDANKHNKQLYEESNERPISLDMKENRWKAFGHMLRLDEKAPCQQAMKYYFTVPENAKRYSGRKRLTLPIILDQDIKTTMKRHPITVTSFENLQDLNRLKEIAKDRKCWRRLVSLICSDVEDDE